MSEALADYKREEKPKNPWLFTPLLYFTQAIPVAMVQEVSAVVFKSMGVENSQIAYWASIISLPWAMQMLLGPFVDLNGTKRGWILWGQALIAGCLILTAAVLHLPNFFNITIGILLVTGIFSALCNIATDGYYVLALSREEQAAFVGLNSTFYRLGRLFCTGLLVYLAGMLMQSDNPHVSVTNGGVLMQRKELGADGKPKSGLEPEVTFTIQDGQLASTNGTLPDPPVSLPAGTNRIEIGEDGTVTAKTSRGGERAGQLMIVPRTRDGFHTEVRQGSKVGLSPNSAWAAVIFLCAAIYGLSRLILPVAMRRPDSDPPRAWNAQAAGKTLLQTVFVVLFTVGAYIGIGNLIHLVGHVIGITSVGFAQSWALQPTSVNSELAWLGGTLIAVGVGLLGIKKFISGTEMGDSFQSFLKQDRFIAILGFLLFYRFGEAMVSRTAPLFLLDPVSKGGIGLQVEQLGIINGIIGVLGIVLGGIVGGLIVSKHGLKKSLVPLAVSMHLPNLLYLWAANARPTIAADAGLTMMIFSPISAIVFIDQFAYGFGFSAYMVYLMWVAQRGNYKTSHYAIGTGLGAAFIAGAGIVTSQLLANNPGTYVPVFLATIVFAIPGVVVLYFIPMEDEKSNDQEPDPGQKETAPEYPR